MSSGGKYSASIMAEIGAEAAARLRGAFYGGKHSSKESKIHIHITDRTGTTNVRLDRHRCPCGGYTFSTIWSGSKMVCRHCGKEYFAPDFKALPVKPLTDKEKELKSVYTELLQGGDLREHPKDDVLVYRDRLGFVVKAYPLEFAQELENTFADAEVFVSTKRKGNPSAITITGLTLATV